MSLLQSLKLRSFALLWSGQTVSRLGDSLYRVALAWWVLEKTGSATAMGTVLVCSMAPMIVFLLLGGVAVDRLPRLRLMLGSDLLRGLVSGAVAALAFAQQLEIWHIYLASVLFGLVDAFFEPAYAAAVPEIVPQAALPSANSLTGLSRQVTGIVGPTLGAAIVGLGGTPTAFALDAASFLISAACLLPIRAPSAPIFAPAAKQSILRDLREGLGAVTASPWLWITIGLAALGNVTSGGPLAVALPFLVKNSLHADVSALGLFGTMNSIGAVLASLWLGRARQLRRRGALGYGSLVLGSAAVLACGLPIGLIGLSLAALVFGFTMSTFGLIWVNTLQEMVPRDLMGRVTSIDFLGSFVLLPVGYALAGWATDRVGPALVFVVGGAASIGLALLGLAHPAIRRLD